MYIFIEKSEKCTDTSVLTKHKSSVKSVIFLVKFKGRFLNEKRQNKKILKYLAIILKRLGDFIRENILNVSHMSRKN